jgi:hypothetical protein
MRIVSLSLFALFIAIAPATASDLNGQVSGWQINGGDGQGIVSDTFTLTASSTITSLEFGEWLIPGDINSEVEASVTSQPNGGTTYFSQMIALTQSNCAANQFGFNVCISGGSVDWNLPAGTYWLNLKDAEVSNGDAAYWDENSGVGCTSSGCPSMAESAGLGTIPSESFTLSGSNGGTTPEPSSALLFGSGAVGIAGMLRRKYL